MSVIFQCIIIGKLRSAFSCFSSKAFVKINHTKAAFINHLIISMGIHSFPRIEYFSRIVCIFVFFQKIFFIAFINIRIFSPHINSFYVREFLFHFGNKFIAKVIKSASASEKENINIFCRNLSFDNCL